MYVISGKYKHKKLEGINLKNTRPTMDRVKESMMAMIQDYIPNSIVLDLFAGSGSLAIEALSMGANKAYFVDNDILAIKTIKNNLKDISEETNILKMDYNKALKYLADLKIKFDIIFLDPPYEKYDLEKIINDINEMNLLNNEGIIVVETTKMLPFETLKSRKISDKIILILEKRKKV